MTRVFNPPPNWPQPPTGWIPTPQWRADPAWGPLPVDWPLWIEAPIPSSTREDRGDWSRKDDLQRVFISYRRSDCQPQANGLFDGLSHRLRSASVFMDIDSIPPGVDFEQHIRDEIAICDVVLVLVGDNWLDARPHSAVRRIDEPEDFVRLEIENALASPRVRVIPVLVEGAGMPGPAELPQSIRRLARINAIELSDRRWTADLERLAAAVEGLRRDQMSQRSMAHLPETASHHKVAFVQSPEVAGFASDRSSGLLHAEQEGTEGAGPPQPDLGEGRYVENRSEPDNIELQSRDQLPPSDNRRVQTAAIPQPVKPPRTTTVGWLMILAPAVSFGFASFAPCIWAAAGRRGDRSFRRRMFGLACLFGVASIAGFTLVAANPTDSSLATIGVFSWLGALVASTVVAVRHRKSRTALPGTTQELARRKQREQYRELMSRDLSLARAMSVGRPDLVRSYDDGGLLDMNAMSVEALHQFAPVPIEEARRIVTLRHQLNGLSSVDEIIASGQLSAGTVARLREVAVFL